MTREVAELRRQAIARDRAVALLLRDFAARDRWLRARLLELHQRLQALDGTPAAVPEWPAIVIPPALAGLLEGED